MNHHKTVCVYEHMRSLPEQHKWALVLATIRSIWVYSMLCHIRKTHMQPGKYEYLDNIITEVSSIPEQGELKAKSVPQASQHLSLFISHFASLQQNGFLLQI